MPRNLEAELARVFAGVARRTWIAQLLQAGTVAAVLVAVSCLVASSAVVVLAVLGLAGLTAAAIIWRGRRARSPAGSARLIETAHPECRNVVITAQELLAHGDRASDWMRARVLRDAVAHAQTVRPAEVVRLARAFWVFGTSAIACAIAVACFNHVDRGLHGALRDAASILSARPPMSPREMTVVAVIWPPPYTGLQPSEAANPDRLSALQGSVVRLTVTGGEKWRIRFGTQSVQLSQRGVETRAQLMLSESGYFAIEPEGAAGAERRLIPVSVLRDGAPSIRIDAPARDLLLPDANSEVPIAVSASDDFGLQTLELRYTRVSGAGEQFEFEEGFLPVTVTRDNHRWWKARALIALASLKLEPGDSLVYRAVARDRRPGDHGLATSDTYFIEIAGPGQAALERVEMPPEGERYALSQQMVVLKIQRLRVRERAMTRAAFEDAAAAIAAEQRAVRANFIFMMGGHVEDEEVEAEQSHEIQEGRLRNAARTEISTAIGHMSRAERGLVALSTRIALPPAKAAVDALQRAFGRNRYILRTLPVRSRIDLSRRLTGELGSASDWQRALPPGNVDRGTREAQALLASMLGLAGRIRAGSAVDAREASALAEQALAIGASDPIWEQTARRLMLVRDAIEAARPASEITTRLNDALAPVIVKAQHGARQSPMEGTIAPSSLLRAWGNEARK